MTPTLVRSLLIVTSIVSASSVLAAPNKRLIEFPDGSQKWMSSSEFEALIHDEHRVGKCGGFMDVTSNPSPVRAKLADRGRSADFENRKLTQGAFIEKNIGELTEKGLLETVSNLEKHGTRYCKSESGVKAAEWIANRFKEIAKNRNDVSVELFKHSDFIQPSVIARIQGKGPHANEIVVIGAHEDSINVKARGNVNASAPGADDDASGVATVIETFRVLIETGFQPDRTLEFMTYAGEEIGLVGSQDIASRYSKSNKQVFAVMQLDMTMYPGQANAIHFVTDNTNASLNKFTQRLVDTYVKAKWSEIRCGYACSDHASWKRAGYASTMPFESTMNGMNPKIHTPEDQINLLKSSFGLNFAKLAFSFITELGVEPASAVSVANRASGVRSASQRF